MNLDLTFRSSFFCRVSPWTSPLSSYALYTFALPCFEVLGETDKFSRVEFSTLNLLLTVNSWRVRSSWPPLVASGCTVLSRPLYTTWSYSRSLPLTRPLPRKERDSDSLFSFAFNRSRRSFSLMRCFSCGDSLRTILHYLGAASSIPGTGVGRITLKLSSSGLVSSTLLCCRWRDASTPQCSFLLKIIAFSRSFFVRFAVLPDPLRLFNEPLRGFSNSRPREYEFIELADCSSCKLRLFPYLAWYTPCMLSIVRLSSSSARFSSLFTMRAFAFS